MRHGLFGEAHLHCAEGETSMRHGLYERDAYSIKIVYTVPVPIIKVVNGSVDRINSTKLAGATDDI